MCTMGIIPACAGSTRTRSNTGRNNRDHPRMCGEHSVSFRGSFHSWGSSPHVRGALYPAQERVLFGGIIPACAGSTHCPPTHLVSARDHPRMCGEHTDIGSPKSICRGSSPHVRGALNALGGAFRRAGIIPACAGSTSIAAFAAEESRDHPRMCGEHPVRRQTVSPA